MEMSFKEGIVACTVGGLFTVLVNLYSLSRAQVSDYFVPSVFGFITGFFIVAAASFFTHLITHIKVKA